jgi:hypothetical protein
MRSASAMLLETCRERRAYIVKRVIPLNSARTRTGDLLALHLGDCASQAEASHSLGREGRYRVAEYDRWLSVIAADLIGAGA